jgi:hypothetical protein
VNKFGPITNTCNIIVAVHAVSDLADLSRPELGFGEQLGFGRAKTKSPVLRVSFTVLLFSRLRSEADERRAVLHCHHGAR